MLHRTVSRATHTNYYLPSSHEASLCKYRGQRSHPPSGVAHSPILVSVSTGACHDAEGSLLFHAHPTTITRKHQGRKKKTPQPRAWIVSSTNSQWLRHTCN